MRFEKYEESVVGKNQGSCLKKRFLLEKTVEIFDALYLYSKIVLFLVELLERIFLL